MGIEQKALVDLVFSNPFNLHVIPATHNRLRFVKDRNCVHTTLDDRWLYILPLNRYLGIPYLYLRNAIASSTIELASLMS